MKFTTFKNWLKKYDRPLSVASLLGGFVFDALTLRRIDMPLENAFLLLHLGVGGAGILWMHFYDARQWPARFWLWLRAALPYLIEFAFGGLFCALLVFYFRGAPLSVSWPFMLVLFVAFMAGEFGRKYYSNLSLQLTLFFLGLYAFAIYHVPIVLGQMGPWIFLLSGVASLAGLVLFVMILAWIIPAPLNRNRFWILLSVGLTFLLINIFYFTGILPPIPLALKDARVYHLISRSEDGFVAQGESYPWYTDWLGYPTLNLKAGEPAYLFSAVFAPTSLKTGTVHDWEFYDEATGKWRSVSRVSLAISGGREEGYRSYSVKSAPEPGLWRVRVETESGQVIGWQKFRVKRVSSAPPLKTEIL